MLNSLRSRLLAFTALVMTTLMLLTGTLVSQFLESSRMSSLQERMRLHSHNLLAVTEIENQQPKLPQRLLDARFNAEQSGLYAQLVDVSKQKLWSSISANKLPVFSAEWSPVGEWRYSLATKGDQTLFVARYGVSWFEQSDVQNGVKNPQPVVWNLVIMKDLKLGIQKVEALENQIWWILSIATLVLLFIQAMVMRWGLLPLKNVSNDLLALQQGKFINLNGPYLKELQPLTSNLNRLLDVERGQRERYRNTLSDLSHSLKTPLSVVTGLTAKDTLTTEDKIEIQQQIERMSQIVKYQLQRSVSSGRVIGQDAILVAPVVRSIINAMKKVYREKTLSISMELDEHCVFHGDENDLMELLGNLLDNACKYTQSSVKVTCYLASESTTEKSWCLKVDDNGPGIQPEAFETILQRGVRLDTIAQQEPGQGLGLALVKDIVDTYGIQLTLIESQLGGSCFSLEFKS